jgi:hypothetical protein
MQPLENLPGAEAEKTEGREVEVERLPIVVQPRDCGVKQTEQEELQGQNLPR